MLTGPPLHRSTVPQWAETPQPLGLQTSARRQPLACLTAGPPPQPSLSKSVDLYPLHLATRKRERWAKGSREPSRGLGGQPEGRLLFPESFLHRTRAGLVCPSICYLMQMFSCQRFAIRGVCDFLLFTLLLVLIPFDNFFFPHYWVW